MRDVQFKNLTKHNCSVISAEVCLNSETENFESLNLTTTEEDVKRGRKRKRY